MNSLVIVDHGRRARLIAWNGSLCLFAFVQAVSSKALWCASMALFLVDSSHTVCDTHYIADSSAVYSSQADTRMVAGSATISLTLLSSDCDVWVYIFNSADREYPLMQLVLEQDSASGSFVNLSGMSSSYLLGLIIEENAETPTIIMIGD